MKRVLLLYCIVFSVPVLAQEVQYEELKKTDWPRHYVSVSVGDAFFTNFLWGGCGSMWSNCVPGMEYYSCEDCSEGEPKTSPKTINAGPLSFAASYHYAINNRFHIGVETNFANISSIYTKKEGSDKLSMAEWQMMHAVMLSLRWQYFDREKVGIYSGFAAGINSVIPSNEKAKIRPAWQLNAFGLRVGNGVFWKLELGFGVLGFVNTGIGMRL